MIRMIRRTLILSVGVGVGFGAGYLKAASDLDSEFLQDMRKLAQELKDEISEAVRSSVEEDRKQTEIFAATAEAVREAANKQTNEPGETS